MKVNSRFNQETLFELPATDRELAVSDQPQARIETYGASALSDSELLSVVISDGKELQAAQRMMAEAGSLEALCRCDIASFSQFEGIGPSRAKRLVAVAELARRITQPSTTEPILNRPELVMQYMAPKLIGLQVEKFWVLCLNRKNRLIKAVEITSGTATSSLAHPREVFRAAISNGATAVVCAHNHPSGDPAPSAADVQVTRQLREAARAVDIELLDHVVLGKANTDPRGVGYYSFREAGVL